MAALNALGHLQAQEGDQEEALHSVREALEIATRIGDRHRQAALHNHLSDLHHRAGRKEEAERSLTEAVKLFAEVEPGAWEPEVWLLSRW
jgi:Flp pilus assembly protein TadD